MKKLLFSLFFLGVVSSISASQWPADQHVGTIRNSVKNELDRGWFVDGAWFIALDDRSFWELIPQTKKRSRTWSEWWNNIIPMEWHLDDSFFFSPRAWELPIQIQVHSALESPFESSDYILENVATGQKVFARLVALGPGCLANMDSAVEFLNNPVGEPISITRNYHFVEGTLILDDDIIWKTYGPHARVVVREKELSYGVGASFDFHLSDWFERDEIQIYECPDQGAIGTIYPYPPILGPLFLLENKQTGQMKYASQLSTVAFSDLFLRYSKEKADDAYTQGYADGYAAGDSANSCDN
ncbi:MAG: hypothetical protein Q8K75_05695 [Chlamydiales bacterium]|nr:hypothetical protein [Chlamydiales bacterium]